jgi:DNA (cytosine-5)-methyltransferase 1
MNDFHADILQPNIDETRKSLKFKPAFTFIDLFAGIGGMRLGLEANNGKCVFSSEWDVHAQKTYFENFREIPSGDIRKVTSDSLDRFDVLSAGFPCQPFSSIGKRQGFAHETQGTLFFEVERIIRDKRPRAFLLENVKGLVTHDEGKTLRVILEHLNKLNYTVWAKVLDASNHGVPQARERIYIVGFDNEKFGENVDFRWPKPNEAKVAIGQFVESGISDRSISEHLQKVYIFKKPDGRPQIIDPKSDGQVKTLVASYHKIQRLSGTFVKDGPTGLRLLSESECKAIMGFPLDFKVPVSRTQAFRQFGNSVAVPVIHAIGEQISRVLAGK